MRRGGLAAVLAALVALAFAPMLPAPVVGDDLTFVEGAPAFALPAGRFLMQVTSPYYFELTGEGTYQPLVTVFHYFVHGRPALYRAAGLLLHLACALLLLALALRVGLSRPAALAAAALFAVYPAHVETLVVSSFKGHVLALAFSLACALCWSRAVEDGDRRWLAGALAAAALGLASKETGLAGPAFCAAYSLLFARRRRPAFQRKGALAGATLCAFYLAWRLLVLRGQPAPEPAPWSPAALAGWYAARLPWPLPLCREHEPPSPAWAAGLLLLGAAVWLGRRRPAALFGLALVVIGLAPVILKGTRYSDSPVADRFLYAPSAGLALALAAALDGAWYLPGLWLLVGSWAPEAMARGALYRDTGALFEQTVRCAPAHPKAWGVLAAYRLEQGRPEEARRLALRALDLAPDYPGARAVLERADAALRARR